MKVIERIRKDPRVSEVWNEGEDGWWVMLKPGHICGNSDTHACHEWDVKTLARTFKTVRPCQCKDCAPTNTAAPTATAMAVNCATHE
jgi:hypothetical protein